MNLGERHLICAALEATLLECYFKSSDTAGSVLVVFWYSGVMIYSLHEDKHYDVK